MSSHALVLAAHPYIHIYTSAHPYIHILICILTCHIIIQTMSHHHTYYVTSSYLLCIHILICILICAVLLYHLTVPNAGQAEHKFCHSIPLYGRRGGRGGGGGGLSQHL